MNMGKVKKAWSEEHKKKIEVSEEKKSRENVKRADYWRILEDNRGEKRRKGKSR